MNRTFQLFQEHFCMSLGFIVFLSLFWSNCVLVVNGQYNSPNHLCGGWFHTSNGSIRFNYTGEANDPNFGNKTDQFCVWTINPGSPAQRTGFTIQVQKLPNLNCTSENRLTISHFNHRSEDVTASETWTCGGPQQWINVPGTVIVVILKSTTLVNGTGFLLNWSESGAWMNRTGLRTMYYSNGRPSVQPLPYFAAGFSRNEISTFAFSKGNNTRGYKLEMTFDNLNFCPNAIEVCLPGNAIVVFGILEDGRLQFLKSYEDNEVDTDRISSFGGLFILVWIGDYSGAGASFQMRYYSVRQKN